MNTWGPQGIMAVCAVSYCLGRQTVIAGVCADWLEQVWGTLPEKAKLLIERDVEREFDKDDQARNTGRRLVLGADCDRAEWERVRKLWRAT